MSKYIKGNKDIRFKRSHNKKKGNKSKPIESDNDCSSDEKVKVIKKGKKSKPIDSDDSSSDEDVKVTKKDKKLKPIESDDSSSDEKVKVIKKGKKSKPIDSDDSSSDEDVKVTKKGKKSKHTNMQKYINHYIKKDAPCNKLLIIDSASEDSDSSDSDSSDSDSSDSDSSDSDSSDSDSSDSDSSDSDSSDSDNDNMQLIKTTKKRYNKIINIKDDYIKFDKLLKLKEVTRLKKYLAQIEDKIDDEVTALFLLNYKKLNNEYDRIIQIDNYIKRINAFGKLLISILDIDLEGQYYSFRIYRMIFENVERRIKKKTEIKLDQIMVKKHEKIQKEFSDQNNNLFKKVSIKFTKCLKIRFEYIKSRPKLKKYLNELIDIENLLGNNSIYENYIELVHEIADYIENNRHLYNKYYKN
jgi:hypothetical protein